MTDGTVQQRLAALERQVEQQKNELNRLGLWQQGKLFSYVAKLFPKKRSVIFLCNDFWGDNVKYAYLAFQKIAKEQNISCRILVGNAAQTLMLAEQGLPVIPPIHQWNLETLRDLLSARVLVACNHFTPLLWDPPLPYFLLQGARFIQMWHGIPFKEIGLLYNDGTAGVFESLRLSTTGPSDILVGSTSKLRDTWRQWLAFREYKAAGYPRTDILMREPTPEDLINADMAAYNDMVSAKAANRKIIIYTPTFRDTGGTSWLEKADIAALASWCKERGYFLAFKLHPRDMAAAENIKQQIPDACFIEPSTDPYPLLRLADLLLTDYSSIALDYLLLDRPILFYWPDHADYQRQSRNLLPEFERYAVGDKAMDGNVLRHNIEATLAGNDPWADKRRELTKQLYDFQDGQAGERVVRLILEQLDMPEQLPEGWGI